MAKVRKAVITAAGRGQRLLPLQTLVDRDGVEKKALQILLTFPFSDQAVNDVKGDYFNLFAKVDLNLKTVVENLGNSRQNALSGVLPLKGLTGGTEGASGNPPLPIPGESGSAQSGQAQPGLGNLFGLLSGGAG